MVKEGTLREGRGPWAGRDVVWNPEERINFKQKDRKMLTSLYQSKWKRERIQTQAICKSGS